MPDFSALTRNQRKTIAMIIQAECAGVAVSRLFKTPYSCKFCGRIQGQPGEKRDRRKLRLLQHESECQQCHPSLWPFAVSHKTYYDKWRKSEEFMAALGEARSEMMGEVMAQAAGRLQNSTLAAANELARQVEHGEKDVDRRQAAIAVLDRADVSTASKGLDPLKEWLEALREVE